MAPLTSSATSTTSLVKKHKKGHLAVLTTVSSSSHIPANLIVNVQVPQESGSNKIIKATSAVPQSHSATLRSSYDSTATRTVGASAAAPVNTAIIAAISVGAVLFVISVLVVFYKVHSKSAKSAGNATSTTNPKLESLRLSNIKIIPYPPSPIVTSMSASMTSSVTVTQRPHILPGTKFSVSMPYKPNLNDEIPLNNIGDIIKVNVVYMDGWAFGTDIKTGAKGCFPFDCLVELPKDNTASIKRPARIVRSSLAVHQTSLQNRASFANNSDRTYSLMSVQTDYSHYSAATLSP